MMRYLKDNRYEIVFVIIAIIATLSLAIPGMVLGEHGTDTQSTAGYQVYLDALAKSKSTVTPKDFEKEWRNMTLGQQDTLIRQAKQNAGKTDNQKTVEDNLNNRVATECTWYNWPVRPIQCLLMPMVSGVGGLFMAVSGLLLRAAAYLFNVLVQWIIIGFGSTIQALEILDGIHTGWEILRDISNIVIIGMFTFIAISMILGIEKFGAKRLVANVLIIAVLINFSLLFSKIIIDAGNFTAFQIYKGMGTSSDGRVDIAGKFFTIVGITGAWDSAALTVNFAKQSQREGVVAGGDTTANNVAAAVKGLAFGIMGATLFLFAAGVLFYGCYLIAVRAVLLVFLMLVSALAFASYLVPRLSDSGYGFKTWLRSLINASIFAPLLMILLYISLVILSPAADKKTGTLGAIFTDSKSVSDYWQTVIIFILGIGMLYVSFRVANSFSQQIAGFSTTGTALKMSAGIPLALTSRAAGLFGRTVFGRRAVRGEIEAGEKIKEARDRMTQFPKDSSQYKAALQDVTKFTREAAKYKARGESSFNLAQTGFGKDVLQKLQVPKAIIGKDKEGAAKGIKATAEDAARKAADVAKLSPEAEAAARKRGEDVIRKARLEDENKLQVKRTKTEEELLEKRKAADAEIERSKNSGEIGKQEKEYQEAVEAKDKIQTQTANLIKELENQRRRPDANEQNINVQIEEAKKNEETVLREQNERINVARTRTKQIVDEINEPVLKVQESLEKAAHALEEFSKETETQAKNSGEQAVRALRRRWEEEGGEAAQAVAAQLIRSGAKNIIPNWTLQRTNDSAVAVATRDAVKKRIKTAGLRERYEIERESLKEAGIITNGKPVIPTTTPPAPPPPKAAS